MLGYFRPPPQPTHLPRQPIGGPHHENEGGGRLEKGLERPPCASQYPPTPGTVGKGMCELQSLFWVCTKTKIKKCTRPTATKKYPPPPAQANFPLPQSGTLYRPVLPCTALEQMIDNTSHDQTVCSIKMSLKNKNEVLRFGIGQK